jgi:hypothetical protein
MHEHNLKLAAWRYVPLTLGIMTENNNALELGTLTLSLLMSYIYGAPCKARNFNVVYILTYVWQR